MAELLKGIDLGLLISIHGAIEDPKIRRVSDGLTVMGDVEHKLLWIGGERLRMRGSLR